MILIEDNSLVLQVGVILFIAKSNIFNTFGTSVSLCGTPVEILMEKKAAAGFQRFKPNDNNPHFVPQTLLFTKNVTYFVVLHHNM